jgi:NitT/TauT family transport system ATP-binding protein
MMGERLQLDRRADNNESASDPAVVVEGVTHQFDGRTVIENVSFKVEQSEFVSIVGPSGCGKTTLLNLIAGFSRPTRGNILMKGEPVDRVQSEKMAYMFARDTLLPWRRAIRNVELALEMGRRGPDQRPARRALANELLGKVGLADFANYYPHQLSQGMRQRVAIARTLAAGADIWLLDEPFGALDPSTRTFIHDEFERIWEESECTVVLVTHDLAEAIAMSDRIVVMSAGPGTVKMIQDIDLPRPRKVSDALANKRFADYYGHLWSELRADMRAGVLGDSAGERR